MQWNKLSKKSRNILGAMAQGNSCKQILADDPTLTCRDIFHAAGESHKLFNEETSYKTRSLGARLQ